MGIIVYKNATSKKLLTGIYRTSVVKKHFGEHYLAYKKDNDWWCIPLTTNKPSYQTLAIQKDGSTLYAHSGEEKYNLAQIHTICSISTGTGSATVLLSAPLACSVTFTCTYYFSSHTVSHTWTYSAGSSGNQTATVLTGGWWWESCKGCSIDSVSFGETRAYRANTTGNVGAPNTSVTNTAISYVYIANNGLDGTEDPMELTFSNLSLSTSTTSSISKNYKYYTKTITATFKATPISWSVKPGTWSADVSYKTNSGVFDVTKTGVWSDNCGIPYNYSMSISFKYTGGNNNAVVPVEITIKDSNFGNDISSSITLTPTWLESTGGE